MHLDVLVANPPPYIPSCFNFFSTGSGRVQSRQSRTPVWA